MDERDDEIADAEEYAAIGEGGGNGERDQEEPAHPDQQQEPNGDVAGWDRIGQPRVPAVHPPDIAEEQEHLEEAVEGRVAEQQAGQLCDGEDEDEVEEQLERADAR